MDLATMYMINAHLTDIDFTAFETIAFIVCVVVPLSTYIFFSLSNGHQRRRKQDNYNHTQKNTDPKPSLADVVYGDKSKVKSNDTQRGELEMREFFNSIISKNNYKLYDFTIYHDFRFQDENKVCHQIDHLLVCPYGVFVFETKNWDGITYFGLTKDNFMLLSELEKIKLDEKRKSIHNYPSDTISEYLDKEYGLTLNFNFDKIDGTEFVAVNHYKDPIAQVTNRAKNIEEYLYKRNDNEEYSAITVHSVLLMKVNHKDDVICKNPMLQYVTVSHEEDLKNFLINNITNNQQGNDCKPLKARTRVVNSFIQDLEKTPCETCKKTNCFLRTS